VNEEINIDWEFVTLYSDKDCRVIGDVYYKAGYNHGLNRTDCTLATEHPDLIKAYRMGWTDGEGDRLERSLQTLWSSSGGE